MNKCMNRLGLCQPATYQIEVVGHLNSKKATWFQCLTCANEYDEDGTPITVMVGEVLDQAMLHGLLAKIRDLGLPLLAVNRIKSNVQNSTELSSQKEREA
jgi:hypothetical protein